MGNLVCRSINGGVDDGGVCQGDVLFDFALFLQGFETFVELSEGDADRNEVDFGGSFLDEFDEVVAVAVNGDEFATALAGFELEGFGSTAAIDVLAVDEAASLLIGDLAAKLFGNSLVIIVVLREHGFDLTSKLAGMSVDFLFDGGFDETEI